MTRKKGKQPQIKAFLMPGAGGGFSNAPGAPAPSEAGQPSASPFAAFGGLDGIMSMMGKVQQMIGIFQQIRPAFNMINAFMAPKATVSSTAKVSNRKQSRTRSVKHRS